MSDVALALNRVADALFKQATIQSKQLKCMERQAAVAEELLGIQKANLAVTKHLEGVLALQHGEHHGRS